MKRCFIALFVVFFCLAVGNATAEEHDIERMLTLSAGLGANDLGDMAWDGTGLWIEGSGSLNKLIGEGHSYNDWISYREIDGFGRGSISALWASGNTIIVSWIYYDYYATIDAEAPHGDGISISLDGGQSWDHIGILDLFPDRADLAVPNRYTTIWDIAVSNGVIWCSTTAGFLLKSENMGLTWENILPYLPGVDESPEVTFDFQNPNHHGQCVDAYGDTIWVGTFQGMNLSVDGGETWTNFSWPLDGSGNPAVDQWPGNFPVAVEHAVVDGKTHVWVASQDYLGLGRIGICHTSDNGVTWTFERYLDYESKPWNIASGQSGTHADSTVYVATSGGLLVTRDLGKTWETIDIRESETSFWDAADGVASVAVVGDTIWVTSANGLARSLNDGMTWELLKGVRRVRTIDTGNRYIGISSEYDYLDDNVITYAFPNPFSPHRQTSDYGRTRIQYALENDARVTIRLYTYSGLLLRELITDIFRGGGRDYQEIWDGRDKSDTIVPNGVYFYTIETDRGDTARGKIMVLD
ncbi:hypothetical protein ACFL5H_01940 [Candidatus Latescibacterota bacterium]